MNSLTVGSDPFNAVADTAPDTDLTGPVYNREEGLNQWRKEAQSELDKKILGFDSFEPEQPPEIRQRALTGAFLETIRPDSLNLADRQAQDAFRDQVANELFSGKGAGDDSAFFGELQKQANDRKSQGELADELQKGALLTALSGQGTVFDVIANNREHPAFKLSDSTRYADGLAEYQADVEETLSPFLPELRELWGDFQEGHFNSVYEVAGRLEESEIPAFIDSLKILVDQLPEEQQATFAANFGKTFTRLGKDILNSAVSGVVKTIANPGTSSEDGELEREEAADDRNRDLFREDIQRIFRNDYKPITPVFSENTVKGSVERGLYAAPEAVSTTLLAAVPGVGAPLVFEVMNEQAREEYRARFLASGLSRNEADKLSRELSPFAAIPQALLERLGGRVVMGKLPVLNRALTKLTDKIANVPARFAGRFAAAGAGETAIELTQDLILEGTQDIAAALNEDLPGVNWQEVFDNYEFKTLETFVAVAPLAILGAAGGISSENRAQAFAKATDAELLAFGAQRADIDAMRLADGPTSQAQAVANVLDNLAPTSEEAKAARIELAEQAKAAKDATQRAAESGIMPRYIVRPNEIDVVSPDGSPLATVENMEQAAQVTQQFLGEQNRLQDVEISRLQTELEGGQVSAKRLQATGAKAEVDMRPGKTLDIRQAALESAERAERVRSQVEAVEALGGSVDLSALILGESSTTFREGQRNVVNRINGGASVLTVFHEESHALWRAAQDSGKLTRDDAIEFLNAFDAVAGTKTTRDGQRQARYLPENFADLDAAQQDVAIDEALAEFAESEVLRTRKDGTLPKGLVSRNLSAIAQMAPGAAKKFANFFRALRGFWELAFTRAAITKRALADGSLDQLKFDEFREALLGVDAQEQHDQQAKQDFEDITTSESEIDTPFSIGPSRDFSSLAEFESESGRLEISSEEKSRITEEIKTIKSVIPLESISLSGRSASRYYYTGKGKIRVSDHSRHGFTNTSAAPRIVVGDSFADIDLINTPVTKKVIEGWVNGEDVSFDSRPQRNLDEEERSQAAKQILAEPLKMKAFKRLEEIASSGINYKGKSKEVKGLWKIIGYKPSGRLADNVSKLRENLRGPQSAGLTVADTSSGVPDEKGAGNYLSGNDTGASSFSLANKTQVASLYNNAQKMASKPEQKLAIFQKIASALSDLKREQDSIITAFGKEHVRKAIVDPRTLTQLKAEARVKREEFFEEIEGEIMASFGEIVENEDLTKLKAQPIHELFSYPNDPLRGRLVSKAAWKRANPGESVPGEFDTASLASPTLFGGSLMPDQAAQEAFEAGLISEPVADALFEGLASEYVSVQNRNDDLKEAKRRLREGKIEARKKSEEWLKDRKAEQERDYNPMARVRRALSMLDAITIALPIEERGRIGGFTTLANLDSDKARLDYLNKKLAKAEEVVERYLRKEQDKLWQKLLKRARPAKDESGKRRQGKAGADVHSLFDELKKAMSQSGEEAQARATALQMLIDGGELSAEQEAHSIQLVRLLPLVANWNEASADQRTQANDLGWKVFLDGYGEYQKTIIERRERREKARTALISAVGKSGKRADRVAKEQEVLGVTPANGEKTSFKKRVQTIGEQLSLGMFSFEQLAQWVFGNESAEALVLADMERAASDQKTDAVNDVEDGIAAYLSALAGGEYKGAQLLYKLSQPSIETEEAGDLSQLQAVTATLMWRQEDGKRHMRGKLDDNGKPVSDWHYDQPFIDHIESKLTAEARRVRDYIADEYAQEWESLNPVHRDLYGIDMPKHELYSPLSVKPSQSKGAEAVNPVTGTAQAGTSTTPGSPRSRSTSAIAEPDFKDALAMFVAHKKQMEHWRAYAPLTQELNAILNNRELGNAISSKAGNQATETLRDWTALFAEGGSRDAAAHLEATKKLSQASGQMASSILIGRSSVLAIQATQLGAAIAEMPMRAYLPRLAKLLTGQLGWKATWRSGYIQRRYKQGPPIVRQALESLAASKPSKVKHLVQKYGQTISGADAIFTGGTYAIIYDYQLTLAAQDGLEGEDAAKRAHTMAARLTNRVAQPTTAANRSLIENRVTNPFGRMWLNFISEPRQKLAMSAYAMAKRPPKEKARATFVTFAVGGGFATLIRTIMRDLKDDEDEELFDEKNWDPKRFAIMSLIDPLGGVPLFGDLAQSAVLNAFGVWSPSGGAGIFSNVADMPGATADLMPWNWDDIDNVDDVLKDVETILQGGAALPYAPGQTSAAYASVTHFLRDLWQAIEALDGPG